MLRAALFGEEAPQTMAQDATGLQSESGDVTGSGVSEKNAEIAARTAEVERLTKERNQSNAENRKVKESLKKMKTGLIAAIIGIVISIIVGYGNYSSLESKLWSANYSRNQLQTSYDALVKDFETSKSLWSVNVTALKVGNWGDGRWLTQAGDTLYSSQMRYLESVITYKAPFDGEATFYIKILDPYGDLKRNADTSPAGYTYSDTMRINRGNNQTLDLGGWGNPGSSVYQAGEWTVEVWYNDVCLRSEKVRIN
jgi:hypothetical protein